MTLVPTRTSRLLLAAILILLAVAGVASPAQAAADDPSSVVPFEGSAELGCTRGSGGPVCYGHHSYDAIDFLMPSGTTLVSPVNGYVTAVSTDCGNHPSGCGNGYGNWVQISAADGTRNYLLAHMSEVWIVDGPVQAGEAVGLSGNSGASSTPHLHYEERTFATGSLDGDQIQPGSMVACLTDQFGWEYAETEHWYDMRSHAGVLVSSFGAGCFASGAMGDVLDRHGLEFAGVLPTDQTRPADLADSIMEWLGSRPVGEGDVRPIDSEIRSVLADDQETAIDFNTVWSMPPLR